jgi:hypothetical protein
MRYVVRWTRTTMRSGSASCGDLSYIDTQNIILARLSAYFGAHLNVQFNGLSPAALSTGHFYA